ncbi:glycosyltransferase family 2 protein [Fulvivirga lutimaris]|uniref:glycosyltransferase family 2 protein n=1 Tax=Fulvivirga lutimaris TaxID=1819566 RepID=UPI0012BBC596|nr:glycosyltransferase family A protein [Fulvivirga lutimaris]MTI38283.1 glycosyltransferase family 2 protein [Fulvivirga lutimaris]
MTDILLSIIIPTYNRKDSIGRSLDSVIQQANKQVEVIVVDDGSTDGTETFIEQQYPRIRYFYQENAGVCAARNHGANMANGQFLYFLDSDDLMEEGTLSILLNSIKQDSSLMLFILPALIFSTRNELIQKIKTENVLAQRLTGAFCIEKDFFIQIGQYDEKLRFSENSDLFIRIRSLGSDLKPYIKALTTGGVNIQKDNNIDRKAKYSKIKYESLKYLLKKHAKYFKNHPTHDRSFRSTLAFQAFYIDRYKEARKISLSIIKNYPFFWKAYKYLFIFLLFPSLAKKYYYGG